MPTIQSDLHEITGGTTRPSTAADVAAVMSGQPRHPTRGAFQRKPGNIADVLAGGKPSDEHAQSNTATSLTQSENGRFVFHRSGQSGLCV